MERPKFLAEGTHRALGRDFLLVFALGFVVRLIYLAVVPAWTAGDSSIYEGVAANLASGHGYSLNGAAYAGREPGYPLVVSVSYLLAGTGSTLVYLFQAIAGALACALTYLLGRRISGRWAGVLASGLLVLSPVFVGYTNVVLTEVFATLWVALGILLLIRLRERLSWGRAVIAGGVLGFGALTRINLLVIVLAAPLLLRAGSIKWREALVKGGLVVAVAVLVLSPWIVRNAATFHAFIPGRTGYAENLWVGSYVPWDGLWLGYVPPLTDLKAGLSEIEADRKLLRETIKNIRRDPAGVALVWAKKPFRIWALSGRTFYPEKLFQKKWQHYVLVFQRMIWLIALAFAAYGLFVERYKPVAILVAGVLIVATVGLLPIVPEWRFAMPLSSGLYALAGAGAVKLFRRFRRKSQESTTASV